MFTVFHCTWHTLFLYLFKICKCFFHSALLLINIIRNISVWHIIFIFYFILLLLCSCLLCLVSSWIRVFAWFFLTLQVSAGVVRRSGHEFKEIELEAVCGARAACRRLSQTFQGEFVN